MPGDGLEPFGPSGPALTEVAAEMDRIFARVGLSQPASDVRPPPAVPALRPSRGNGSTATLLIAAATGLVGLGAGALVFRAPGPSAPVAAPMAVKVTTRSEPRPVQPQPQPPATPPIALAEAAPPLAIEPTPAQSPPAAKASSATKSRSAALRLAHSRAQFRLKLAALGGPGPAQAKPPIRLNLPAPVANPAICEHDPDGEGCRSAVIQADRHLRAVYEHAFERGVSRRVLVDYRDRWAGLRVRNNDDPTRLIESYGALAYDLGRETADGQDNEPHPRSRSGLKAMTDLPPWR